MEWARLAMGLSQTFSDRYASCVRGQHGLTCGYGLGFQTAEFLSEVASKQVWQSAIPLQIVRGKTLRQAQNYSPRCLLAYRHDRSTRLRRKPNAGGHRWKEKTAGTSPTGWHTAAS